MKPSAWIPAVLTVLYFAGTYFAGQFASRGSWVDFAAPTMWIVAAPSAAVLWAAWAFLTRRRQPHAARWLLTVGVVLPFLWAGAISAAASAYDDHRTSVRSRQLAHARVFELRDEALLGSHGHPLGVRLRYTVRFEEGLDDKRFEPSAMLGGEPNDNLPGGNLGVHRVEVTPAISDRYLPGEYQVISDFFPGFLPRFMQIPELSTSSVSSDRCFSWGNQGLRDAALRMTRRPFRVRIDGYGINQLTSGRYSLAEFVDSALLEGARECGN